MKINIEKTSPIPTYKQIKDRIKEAISSGELQSGERLPAERDLAKELGIARGTITKAYLELENDGLISMTQGKGTFVSESGHQLSMPNSAIDRETRAALLVQQFVDAMHSLDFSHSEIEKMVADTLRSMNKEREPLLLAAIDCNPEALAIYERQLFPFPEIHIVKILIDSLPEGKEGESKLAPYDLIITTTTHTGELSAKYPSISDKLMAVSVAPTRETVARLARLNFTLRVGAICESKRFFSIISNYLKDSNISLENTRPLYFSELDTLPQFIASVDAIVIPPGFSLMQQKEHIADIQKFTERGGIVLPFDYQIERGSIIHMNEKLNAISARK
jgi:DNA-binding transcriptional regulator YhcF (GntR family)